MPKRAKRSSSTRIAALLFVTVLMTLVVIALGSSVRSDYAEALIPDRTFIGAGLGSKPSSSTPGDGKVVARQATVASVESCSHSYASLFTGGMLAIKISMILYND